MCVYLAEGFGRGVGQHGIFLSPSSRANGNTPRCAGGCSFGDN